MNKKTLATQATRILVGGNLTPEQDIDIREVQLIVGQVADELLQDYLFLENKYEKNVGFNVSREYLRRYVLDVVDNVAKLTVTPLKLPKNATIYEAVIEGSSCEVEGQMLIPIFESIGMFKRRESSNLEGYYGYQIDYANDGVNIRIINDSKGSIEQIGVYIVPSSEKLGVEEEMPVPYFLQDKIIEKTVKRFLPHVEIPHDDKLDNKDGSR